MAHDIALILVFAFFYLGIAFHHRSSFPVVNLFSEEVQNVFLSGL